MSGANRREESALATRQLLIDEAANLFSGQGYANTSLSKIAANVGATKGALYHHFSNKKELYAICYEQQAARVAAVIKSVKATSDPWQDTLAQCRAFLDCATMPELKAVPIQEAITVLGWQQWRALDTAHTMGELEHSLMRLHKAGLLGNYDIKLLASSIFSMMVNTMMTLTTSQDKTATKAELMHQFEALLSGVMIK